VEPDQSQILIAAAEIIGQVNHVIASEKCSNELGVMTINAVDGGEDFCNIPDKVVLHGTLRTLSSENATRLKSKLMRIVSSVADTYNCRHDETDFNDMYPATVNWPEYAKIVSKVAKQVFGEENVSDSKMPNMASEDFSYFLLEKPGAFFWLGTNEDGTGLPNLHCPDNDFNDKLIPKAVELWIKLLEDRFSASIW